MIFFDVFVYGIVVILKIFFLGSFVILYCINLFVYKVLILKFMSISVKDVKKGVEKDLDDFGDVEKF